MSLYNNEQQLYLRRYVAHEKRLTNLVAVINTPLIECLQYNIYKFSVSRTLMFCETSVI